MGSRKCCAPDIFMGQGHLHSPTCFQLWTQRDKNSIGGSEPSRTSPVGAGPSVFLLTRKGFECAFEMSLNLFSVDGSN